MTKYSRNNIERQGLSLLMDIEDYNHNINSTQPIYTDIKSKGDLCLIYANMRYQDIFPENDLNHDHLYMNIQMTQNVNLLTNVMHIKD